MTRAIPRRWSKHDYPDFKIVSILDQTDSNIIVIHLNYSFSQNRTLRLFEISKTAAHISERKANGPAKSRDFYWSLFCWKHLENVDVNPRPEENDRLFSLFWIPQHLLDPRPLFHLVMTRDPGINIFRNSQVLTPALTGDNEDLSGTWYIDITTSYFYAINTPKTVAFRTIFIRKWEDCHVLTQNKVHRIFSKKNQPGENVCERMDRQSGMVVSNVLF